MPTFEEILEHPERLWSHDLCTIHKCLFGKVYLIESHCANCPGKDGSCSGATKDGGYVFADNCPDAWYDMPCCNLNGALRSVYLIHVNHDGKTYKAYDRFEAMDFIVRYVLGWKGPNNREIEFYCEEVEVALFTTLFKRDIDYYGVCVVNAVNVKMLMQVDPETGNAKKVVRRLYRDWLDMVKAYHLEEYGHVGTVKGYGPAPEFIKKLKKPMLFGKACPMRTGGITGDAFCLECKFNEQSERYKTLLREIEENIIAKKSGKPVMGISESKRDIFGWHSRMYVCCNYGSDTEDYN